MELSGPIKRPPSNYKVFDYFSKLLPAFRVIIISGVLGCEIDLSKDKFENITTNISSFTAITEKIISCDLLTDYDEFKVLIEMQNKINEGFYHRTMHYYGKLTLISIKEGDRFIESPKIILIALMGGYLFHQKDLFVKLFPVVSLKDITNINYYGLNYIQLPKLKNAN